MGPYEINQIDKKGQWIKIQGLKDWIHIKNTKKQTISTLRLKKKKIYEEAGSGIPIPHDIFFPF
jgi:hypothetical protein